MKNLKLIIIILLLGCNSSKNTSVRTIESTPVPQIVFVTYRISIESDTQTEIQFISKIISDGKLKKNINHNHAPKEGDLKCFQLDRKSKSLDSLIITNPLLRNVEYADPSGLLTKKQIKLDSADFSVRMPLHPNTKFISIEQIHNPSTKPIIIEL